MVTLRARMERHLAHWRDDLPENWRAFFDGVGVDPASRF